MWSIAYWGVVLLYIILLVAVTIQGILKWRRRK